MPYYKVNVDWSNTGVVNSTIVHDSLNAAIQDAENCMRMAHDNEQTIVTIHRIPSAQVNQHMPNE